MSGVQQMGERLTRARRCQTCSTLNTLDRDNWVGRQLARGDEIGAEQAVADAQDLFGGQS